MKTFFIISILLLSYKLPAQEDVLPAKVEEAFYSKYSKVSGLEWNIDNNMYILEYYRGGTLFTSIYDKSGIWIETAEVIADTDIPIVLQQYLKTDYPTAGISYSEKVETSDQKYFFRVNLEDSNGIIVVRSDLAGQNIQVLSP